MLATGFRIFALAPYFDEYDQVGAEIRDVINKIYASGCRPPRIIVTDDSLGVDLRNMLRMATNVSRTCTPLIHPR